MPGLHITKNLQSKYFLTLTVIEWIDIFTKDEYFRLLVNSLNFCIKEKGLIINGYVFMTNHIHLLADTRRKLNLADIIRDFKRHTTKGIIKLIDNDNRGYIRRLLFKSFSKKKSNKLQVWKPQNWPILVESIDFYNQKLEYIHNNPVEKGFVNDSCNWQYSSATDYFTNDHSPVKVIVE